MIDIRTHAIIDYVVGALLIIAPWLFGFATGGPAMWVPVLLGLGIIAYSLFTNYSLSLARVISFRFHLALDAVGGVILFVSPWLFGFAGVIWWPHVLVGLAELGVVAMTARGMTADYGR